MSFNAKYQDIDEYDDIKNTKENYNLVSLFSIISTWFIRIGIVIGAMLLVYFIVVGKIFSAFIFIIGLIIAYFFGHFFMFCLDKLTEMND